MSDGTKIEWTDATWNPITGCSVVSAGCRNCYAMKLAGTRLQHHQSRAGLTVDTKAGPVWNGQVKLNDKWLEQPVTWSRQRMVFVCAHADLFHENVPDDWIDTVFGIMWACLYGRNELDGHIFQVLTKRADRMRAYLSHDRREAWARAAVNYGGGSDPDGIYDQVAYFEGSHPRIWIGVSVEDQAAADERIPLLLQTPAAVRWISAEPLLGAVDLSRIQYEVIGPSGSVHYRRPLTDTKLLNEAKSTPGYSAASLDWVVVGGESGQNARPMHPDWARSLRDQCAAAGVPFLFKQWGEWLPRADAFRQNLLIGGGAAHHTFGDVAMARVGKKFAGRLLDGVLHDGYPEGAE